MLRDNLVGLIEPMITSPRANPLVLRTATKKPSDDRPPCLENPRPEGAELTLTENAPSPFHAEPKQGLFPARSRIPRSIIRVDRKSLDTLPQGDAAEKFRECETHSCFAAMYR